MTRRFVHFVAPQAANKASAHLNDSRCWGGNSRPAASYRLLLFKVHLFSPLSFPPTPPLLFHSVTVILMVRLIEALQASCSMKASRARKKKKGSWNQNLFFPAVWEQILRPLVADFNFLGRCRHHLLHFVTSVRQICSIFQTCDSTQSNYSCRRRRRPLPMRWFLAGVWRSSAGGEWRAHTVKGGELQEKTKTERGRHNTHRWCSGHFLPSNKQTWTVWVGGEGKEWSFFPTSLREFHSRFPEGWSSNKSICSSIPPLVHCRLLLMSHVPHYWSETAESFTLLVSFSIFIFWTFGINQPPFMTVDPLVQRSAETSCQWQEGL